MSPPGKSQTRVNSSEKLQVMMPSPNKKYGQVQMLKLADEVGREQFFASRNLGHMGAATTSAKKPLQEAD